MSEDAGPEFWDEGARQATNTADWCRRTFAEGRYVVLTPGDTLPQVVRRYEAEAERRRRVAAAMRGGGR